MQKDMETLRKVMEDLEVEHGVSNLTINTTPQWNVTFVQNSLDRTREELQDVLSKRDLEILRLREQRDAREVELKERKARESTKIQLASQYKQLADAREVRLHYEIGCAPWSLISYRNVSLLCYWKLDA